MRNGDIKKAKEELEKLNGDYEIQRLADLREKAIRDEASRLHDAIQKGLEQGLAQGRKEGIKEGRKNMLETAKKLLELGMTIDDVVNITNLKKEEVLNLT